MTFGENQSAKRTVAVRALLFAAVAATALSPLVSVVAAEPDKQLARELSREADDPITTSSINASAKMRFLSLGIGKSVVVDLPRDV